MHFNLYHLWDLLECAVDKMSAPKAAIMGGAGSIASLATATVVPDFTVLNEWTKMIAFLSGAVGGVLSVGLIVLKAWLELRRKPKGVS